MYYFDAESAKLLFTTAEKMGLQPSALTDYGLVEITVDGKPFYLLQSVSMFNSQLSAYLAKHKHLTRIILGRNGLPNIPYVRTAHREEIVSFLDNYHLIIAKPVMGSRSKDIHLISKIQQLDNLPLEEYIFEEYISGKEMRYIVLQNKIVSVLEKRYEGPINNSEIAERISYPQESWDANLVTLALRAADCLRLGFSAVDFLIDTNGKAFILEVNSAPALRRIQQPTSGPGIDIARLFLEATVATIRNASHPFATSHS